MLNSPLKHAFTEYNLVGLGENEKLMHLQGSQVVDEQFSAAVTDHRRARDVMGG